jgi:hypothetical protein
MRSLLGNFFWNFLGGIILRIIFIINNIVPDVNILLWIDVFFHQKVFEHQTIEFFRVLDEQSTEKSIF